MAIKKIDDMTEEERKKFIDYIGNIKLDKNRDESYITIVDGVISCNGAPDFETVEIQLERPTK